LTDETNQPLSNVDELRFIYNGTLRKRDFILLEWSISSPWVQWDYLSGEQSLKCRMGVVNSGIKYELRNPT
ncbi:hypothetical protein T06_6550, partial [Trichinella sp. T6]